MFLPSGFKTFFFPKGISPREASSGLGVWQECLEFYSQIPHRVSDQLGAYFTPGNRKSLIHHSLQQTNSEVLPEMPELTANGPVTVQPCPPSIRLKTPSLSFLGLASSSLALFVLGCVSAPSHPDRSDLRFPEVGPLPSWDAPDQEDRLPDPVTGKKPELPYFKAPSMCNTLHHIHH